MRNRLFAAALLGAFAFAQTAYGAENLDPLLEDVRAKHNVPALAALVLKDGEVVAEGAVGERAYGSGVAVTRDDLWHIGSNTKAMTAFLAQRLIDQRLMARDENVGRVFANVAPMMRDAWRDVTLDDLFSHRSGLPANLPGLAILMFKGDGRPLMHQRASFAEAALASLPAGERGAHFEYSNTGFVLASSIMEHVAAEDFETLIDLHVFQPLGITQYGWGPPGDEGTLDQPVAHDGVTPITSHLMADNPAVFSGAGTLHISMRDWAKFADAMLDAMAGDTSLISELSLSHLITPQHEGSTYAGGWALVTPLGAGVMAHEGSNTLWYAIIAISPRTNTAILLASNSGAARDAEVEVLQALIGQWPL